MWNFIVVLQTASLYPPAVLIHCTSRLLFREKRINNALPKQTSVSSALPSSHQPYTLYCPQLGRQFESINQWHDLKRVCAVVYVSYRNRAPDPTWQVVSQQRRAVFVLKLLFSISIQVLYGRLTKVSRIIFLYLRANQHFLFATDYTLRV